MDCTVFVTGRDEKTVRRILWHLAKDPTRKPREVWINQEHSRNAAKLFTPCFFIREKPGGNPDICLRDTIPWGDSIEKLLRLQEPCRLIAGRVVRLNDSYRELLDDFASNLLPGMVEGSMSHEAESSLLPAEHPLFLTMPTQCPSSFQPETAYADEILGVLI